MLAPEFLKARFLSSFPVGEAAVVGYSRHYFHPRLLLTLASSDAFSHARLPDTHGQFESGITAQWLGTMPAVVLGGIGTVVIVALWPRLFPSLRQVDRLTEIRAFAAPLVNVTTDADLAAE